MACGPRDLACFYCSHRSSQPIMEGLVVCVYSDQIISVTTMPRVFVLAMSLLAASHFSPSGYGYGVTYLAVT